MKIRSVIKKDKSDTNTKATAIRDRRISVCSDCKFGIFESHEREWTNRGLVHTTCL